MRNRTLPVLFLALGLLWTLAPLHAAGSPWSVWLYENEIGRMTYVDDSGAMLRQFILPATSGSLYSYSAAVSGDGRLIAYVTTEVPADSSAWRVTLNIYDADLNTVIYAYSLPSEAYHSLDFSASHFNYSPGSASFAFGYASPSINWEVVVIDLTVFDVFTLRAGDPAAATAGVDTGFGFLVPVVKHNSGEEVRFSMVPSGTEGAPEYPSYTWTLSTGSVSASDIYVSLDTDTLPLNGEVVMSLSDSRFPNHTEAETGFPLTNTLQVYDPASGARYPFYSSTAGSLYWPRFIEGGERIVAGVYDSAASDRSWQVLERSGAVSGSLESSAPRNNLTSIAGLLNGFVYTAGGGSGRAGGTTLYYVETRLASAPYAAASVWNSSLGANARIAWVSDALTASTSPFTAWARLAPPAEAASAGEGGDVVTGVLAVGGSAVVYTTEGDLLNIRTGPGRSFERVGQLANGAEVTLLEGPRSADGFVWWRIRASNGVEGWVVQEADGIPTLIAVGSGAPGGAPGALPAPAPLSPADGSIFNLFPRTTTLTWSPAPGASIYIVEVEYCSPGTSPLQCTALILDKVDASQTHYTFDFVGAQPGRWRVWAADASGNESAKSDWWTFTHQQ